MTDRFSKKERSHLMSKIRGKWTQPEREFFRKNPNAVSHPCLPYNPDFLLGNKVLFLDSTFWHGHVPQKKYDKMKPYWKDKIFKRIMRDESADKFYGEVGEYERQAV